MTSLLFDEERHEYSVNGIVWPHVTGILEQMGLTPRYPAGPYRVRGHRVHQATVLFDQGVLGEYDIGEDLVPYVERYKSLVAELKPEYDMIEQPLHHSVYCYAGTVDRRGLVFRKPSVLDLKTGGTGDETALQLAAYVLLAYPTADPRTIQRYKLDLSSGDGRLVKYEDPDDFDAWLGILSHWRWLQKKKSRPMRNGQ